MHRIARIALLSSIVLAGLAALVIPRLDDGDERSDDQGAPGCEVADDVTATCAGDDDRLLADALVVAGMVASSALVLRNRRDQDNSDASEQIEADGQSVSR